MSQRNGMGDGSAEKLRQLLLSTQFFLKDNYSDGDLIQAAEEIGLGAVTTPQEVAQLIRERADSLAELATQARSIAVELETKLTSEPQATEPS